MSDNENAVRPHRGRGKEITRVSMTLQLRADETLARRWEARAQELWDRANDLKAQAEEMARKAHAASESAAGTRGLLHLMDEAGGAVAYIERRNADGYHVVDEWVMPDGSRKSARTPDTCPVHGTKLVDDCPHFEPEASA